MIAWGTGNFKTSSERLIIRAIRQVPLVEQELLTLPWHLSSSQVFSGVHVAQSLFFCVVFCRSLFVLFLLAIVLSVWLTASGYPFGIFKFFLDYVYGKVQHLKPTRYCHTFLLLVQLWWRKWKEYQYDRSILRPYKLQTTVKSLLSSHLH